MRLTFLGTGSTEAAPLYGCACPACAAARTNPDSARKPASVEVEAAGQRILIDGGLTDLAERYTMGDCPPVLLTHFHVDHVQGLFRLRWGQGTPIPVFCPPDTEGCADLYKHPGLLVFNVVEVFEPFVLGDVSITPVPLAHSRPTFGYCLAHGGRRLAYLTDTVGLPGDSEDFLREFAPDHLVIDCSFPPLAKRHGNHNDLTTALLSIEAVRPRRAWLTHIGHRLDTWLEERSQDLPSGIGIARDGLSLEWVTEPGKL